MSRGRYKIPHESKAITDERRNLLYAIEEFFTIEERYPRQADIARITELSRQRIHQQLQILLAQSLVSVHNGYLKLTDEGRAHIW